MTNTVSTVVLDSTVVSYLFDNSGPAAFYAEHIRGKRPVISFQTLEEVRFGMLRRNWGARRINEMRRHLQQYEVIWATQSLIDVSIRLRVEREGVGRKMSTADAWIAATAVLLECPLASHDGDFVGITNLELIRAPS